MAATNLILGFGGTGTHILSYLKELTVYKHGTKPGEVSFLQFDTIADWKPGGTVKIAGGAGAEETIARSWEEANQLLVNGEYFQLQDRHPSLRALVTQHLSPAGDRENYPQFKDWLHSEWLSSVMNEAVLNITAGSAQQRQIGRFAMFANAEGIVAELGARLRDLSRLSGGAQVNIWVVGSAAGGTGAGCMIDAAYLARLAARQSEVNIKLLGAIVFPEVYGDGAAIRGISYARAYSFFRELNRCQERGLELSDRYSRDGMSCSSEVLYDNHKQLRAVVPSKLFDYLVYFGSNCQNEKQRVAFFNSVANALDPYIDAQVGPVMMEALVNQSSLPFTLGGARLNMPLTTYAELFSWEMVQDVYVRLFAPKEEAGQVTGVHWGSDRDRAASANGRVTGLLPLFEQLLTIAEGPAEQARAFASNRLAPREIIDSWYQFAGTDSGNRGLHSDDLEFIVPLVHRNPFISLEADPADVEGKDALVKTYDERRKAKEPSEDQETSRGRFAAEIRGAFDAYFDPHGGEGSFEHGRRTVQTTMEKLLAAKIDQSIATEFAHHPSADVQTGAEQQGTVLTRLYGDLRQLVSPEGPLTKIETLLATMVQSLQDHERYATQSATDALAELVKARPSGLGRFTHWVEQPQRNTRERYGELVSWRQKIKLTEDVRALAALVRKRYEAWLAVFDEVIAAAVLTREGNSPALRRVRAENVERLHGRLRRMASNDTATSTTLISLEAGDTTMQGFVETLRKAAIAEQGKPQSTATIEDAHWEPTVGDDGRPRLSLRIGKECFSGHTLTRLPETLQQRFHPVIGNRLQPFDIFDYLLYLRQRFGTSMRAVTELLLQPAKVLLDVPTQTCNWVFKAPAGGDKAAIVGELESELRNLRANQTAGAQDHHTDRTSLNLVCGAATDPDRIPDLLQCESAYLASLSRNLSANAADAHEVERSVIYHAFRGEAEAWFIERAAVREGETNFHTVKELIPARVTRLLAQPDHFQAFIQCLATKAVYYCEDSLAWFWRAPGREEPIALNSAGFQAEQSFFNAAAIFVLQQSEARRQGRVAITLKAARESAQTLAKADFPNQPLHQVVADFVSPANLESFFAKACPPPKTGNDPVVMEDYERELRGLTLVFRFYGRPGAQTALSARTL